MTDHISGLTFGEVFSHPKVSSRTDNLLDAMLTAIEDTMIYDLILVLESNMEYLELSFTQFEELKTSLADDNQAMNE